MENEKHNQSVKAGLIAGLIAYVLWGIFPVYFKLTAHIAPFEILGHRILWAVPFGALIIFFKKQWPDVKQALITPRTLGLLTLAALFISLNWGLYIWAVQQEEIFQTSLGYYINPLLFVLVGVVFLGDKLRRLQIIAVALATIGVCILAFYGGKIPWISLILACSFTMYGVIRKQVDVGAMPGLFIETIILLIPVLIYLSWLQNNSTLTFGHTDTNTNLLLMLAGPITVIPLAAFAFAARRLRLSTIGFLQFIAPSMQFMTALYYGETLTPALLICFAFIWSAAILFALDAIRPRRN